MSDSFHHLLDIESTPLEALSNILDTAEAIIEEPEAYLDCLRGRLLINLFYEPSTRTRVSFEIAARRLGMHVVNMAAASSSVVKGESLRDTYRTLAAMAPDVIVLRHPDNGAPAMLADLCPRGPHLVNAGDGSRAHPSQALLDLLTIRQHFSDLGALRVLVAGDLNHSRVTRSGVALMKKLGVGEIRLAAPRGLEADVAVAEGTRCFDSFEEALDGVDVVMMLRVQRERLQGMEVPDSDAYQSAWGLNAERLALAAPHAIVMHPGPMHRGVEVTSEVADGPRSVIDRQVANGVFTRMAILHALVQNTS